MLKTLKAKLRAFFEAAFPARQIYHKSGGSVRYLKISPWRQAMMAGAATLIVGWCMFATMAVLLRGPQSKLAQDARLNAVLTDLSAAKAEQARLWDRLSVAQSQTATLQSQLNSLSGGRGDAVGELVSQNALLTSNLNVCRNTVSILEASNVEINARASDLQAQANKPIVDLRSAYHAFSKLMRNLEPNYTPEPKEELDRFFGLLSLFVASLGGGIGLILTLLMTRFAVRVKVDSPKGSS